MPCYIIRAGDTDKVKIGWSDESVETRCRTLQTAHYERLAVIRIIDGVRGIERWMHARFAERHVLGEWFRFSPEMMTVTPAGGDEIYHPHFPVIEAFGGPGPLAASIGLRPPIACHWARRGIPAKYWHRVVDAAVTLDPPVNVSAHLLESLPAQDPRTEAA